MQRQILCLLILACASFILVNEVGGDAVADVESGGAARKLLQEKTKIKAAKSDKPKVKNADASPKAKLSSGTKDASEGTKLKEKSRDLDVIQVASKNPDGSKTESTGSDHVKKPASGGKKGKRVLDEEDDEDIKFMEEEKMEGEEKSTSSKQAQTQTQEGKSKKKGLAKKKDGNAGKIKDATEHEGLADEGKESVEKKTDDTKVTVDTDKEEMDSQDVEVIPDDEPEEQKGDVSEEKQTQEGPEQKEDEQKEEENLVQKDKNSEGKVLDQKEQIKKKKKKNVEERVPDTVSALKKPSTKNGKRPQDKDLPKGNGTKSKTAAKEKQKPDPKANAKLTTKANSTKKRFPVRGGEILQKEPKEQMPINFGAGEDVEDLQTDAVLSKTGVDIQGDEEENEDIDFIQEFQNLPNKFHQTAEQVAETLRPGLQKISEKSRTYFSHANEQMTHSFTPIMGEQVAPVVASLISYALLLIPLVVVLYMLERIRATLSLAKVLFFINIYLGAYFITLVLATFALRSEPMAFFFRNSRSSCVFLQLLQALGYLFYLLLYTVVFVKSCSNAGILDRLVSGFQWVIVALFGLHYYVTVFHRAMAMKAPRTTWKVYLVYSAAFAILALFARAKIEPTKKEYYYSPVDDPDEVIPVDKRS